MLRAGPLDELDRLLEPIRVDEKRNVQLLSHLHVVLLRDGQQLLVDLERGDPSLPVGLLADVGGDVECRRPGAAQTSVHRAPQSVRQLQVLGDHLDDLIHVQLAALVELCIRPPVQRHRSESILLHPTEPLLQPGSRRIRVVGNDGLRQEFHALATHFGQVRQTVLQRHGAGLKIAVVAVERRGKLQPGRIRRRCGRLRAGHEHELLVEEERERIERHVRDPELHDHEHVVYPRRQPTGVVYDHRRRFQPRPMYVAHLLHLVEPVCPPSRLETDSAALESHTVHAHLDVLDERQHHAPVIVGLHQQLEAGGIRVIRQILEPALQNVVLDAHDLSPLPPSCCLVKRHPRFRKGILSATVDRRSDSVSIWSIQSTPGKHDDERAHW